MPPFLSPGNRTARSVRLSDHLHGVLEVPGEPGRLFAGATAILAKAGMKEVGPDVALALRTCVVFVFVLTFVSVVTSGRPFRGLGSVSMSQGAMIVQSGATGALSWIFFCRAMQTGTVPFVSLVDKGSIILTLLLSWWLLKEPLTPKPAAGAALIVAGLLTLGWK